jgi:hypothetical protein
MKFQEAEVVEMGLAGDLIKIEVGQELENPPAPTPTFDPVSVYIPEAE